MSPQRTSPPSVVLPPMPPALVDQDVAEEFVSAVGWGLHEDDSRALDALSTDPAVLPDPYLQALWAAMTAQAGTGDFTWGLVRQRLLEGGMSPAGWPNGLFVHQIATRGGFVTLGRIPALRGKLEELHQRRMAWDAACRLLEAEGVPQW